MSVLKFRMAFTLTTYVEKSPSHNRDVLFTVRRELMIYEMQNLMVRGLTGTLA